LVKNRSPKLCAWLAWIWLPVTVLSAGVGWKGDAAAAVGWAAVDGAVAVVGVVVVRGADGVAELAGAAGAACRGGLRRRASTVTGGSGLAPGSAGGGVVCGAGVSDAGGVVSGVSAGGDGVCDHATPVKQSANSAELLRSSKRLLRIDMTIPSNPSREMPVGPDDRCAAKRRRMGHRLSARLREARPIPAGRCQARGGARAPSGEE
jgi:hypothetical protein